MRNVSAMMSSKTVEWETPPDFFARLHNEFAFTLDVCANPANAKCPRFFTVADDGLSKSWAGEVCWMNPPFGKTIGKWIRKSHWESKRGATVVALIPARVDTGWWHDYCQSAEVRFVRGRITFVGAPHNAPFPCAVVIFRPVPTTPKEPEHGRAE